MNRRSRRGQTLVESLGALWLLLIFFFCIYYIFLISIDKMRSLDTVYHLARAQEVQNNQETFIVKSIDVMEKCFGRLGISGVAGVGDSAPPVSEVSFQYIHNFSPSLFSSLHKSMMRVVQPNADYLTKSYPSAAEDNGGMSLLPQLVKEQAILVFLAKSDTSSLLDALDDLSDFVDGE